MNVTGYWIGTLTYGPEYDASSGKTLQFDIDFTQTDKELKGLSKDISGFGMNQDPADIIGKLVGNELQFIKRYRTMHSIEDSFDKARKGPKIYYSGHYNDELREFKGTWTIEKSGRFFGLIPMIKRSTGTWKMKREDERKVASVLEFDRRLSLVQEVPDCQQEESTIE